MKPGYYYSKSWQMNYYFYIGWTWKDFVSYMKEKFKYEAVGRPDGLVVTMNNHLGKFTGAHIWVPQKRNYPVLAHECLHAVNFTMAMRSVVADWDNDEPQAYLLTALMKEALNAR